MAAISLLWKKSLRNQDISNLVDASQVTLSTRAIYAAILKKKHEPLSAENKTLRHGYSKSDLSKVYSLPFKITKKVKLQTLQYKILPSVLPTQASLYQDGIKKKKKKTAIAAPFSKVKRNHLTTLSSLATKLPPFGPSFKLAGMKNHENRSS